MNRILTLLLLAPLAAGCNKNEVIELPAPVNAAFDRICEFRPAPGQFVNEYYDAATMEEACDYAQKRLRSGYYVSLGSWGGCLVAAFDHPVVNDGGYNLRILGNSFDGSSEPGVVWVMRDENGNGEPDDTWYELAGSERDNPATRRGYSVTYFRPASDGEPVRWMDCDGREGTVDRVNAHAQPYFPAWIAGDSYTLGGTLLPDNIVQEGGEWHPQAFAWGYVDNYGADRLEGAPSVDATVVANHLRISDAVDAAGEPVNLPEIHFVKIQTGVLAKAPAIGEVSTEVAGIYDFNLLK
ncbi:hypothetical protein [Alistipes sp.]|uniref:hypothetical protein n=1 Tax=Alistipes sp. TaxID=1872444 RepID=UPI0011C9DB0E